MNETTTHHVAYKDRTGLNQQWSRDIQRCSDAYGTPEYITSVDRFRNNIINIHNGPQLSDIIDNYWKESLQPLGKQLYLEWADENKLESKVEEDRADTAERIRQFQAEKLYKYMLQTLENNGFVFYESKYEEEDKMV